MSRYLDYLINQQGQEKTQDLSEIYRVIRFEDEYMELELYGNHIEVEFDSTDGHWEEIYCMNIIFQKDVKQIVRGQDIEWYLMQDIRSIIDEELGRIK